MFAQYGQFLDKEDKYKASMETIVKEFKQEKGKEK